MYWANVGRKRGRGICLKALSEFQICSLLYSSIARMKTYFAEVDQTEHVLLETASAEADTRSQKVGPNSGVPSDGMGYVGDVGSGGLADRRHGVDAGDPLG
jgi:hypothetical protein